MRTVAVITIGMSVAMFASAQAPQDIDDSKYRTKLMRPEVATLPFFGRDRLLLKTNPEYAKLPATEAFAIIRRAEADYANSKGVQPLQGFVWYEGCKGCSHFYRDGRQYLTVEYGSLNLAVSVGQFEKFVDAHVIASLDENSSINIDLLPAKISLSTLEPQVVPVKPAALKDVAKSVRHGAGWKAALVAGLGGMATRTSTTHEEGRVYGGYSGSSGSGSFNGSYSGTATTTEPDYAARARAARRAQEIRASADVRSDSVAQTALRGTTVSPGKLASGFVYFERDKKQQLALLQVIIGTVSLEFPFRW